MNYLEKRNLTIDLLRALTMAVMLMVNDFWSVSGIPHWMKHAKATEDMLGFSDVVFPSFLFCVGLSIPYAITAMRRKGRSEGDVVRHILSRSFALILMGAFICNYESGIDPSIGYDRNAYCLLMTLAFFLVFNRYEQSDGWLVRGLKAIGWAILLFLLVTSRSPEGRVLSSMHFQGTSLHKPSHGYCFSLFASVAPLRPTTLYSKASLYFPCQNRISLTSRCRRFTSAMPPVTSWL